MTAVPHKRVVVMMPVTNVTKQARVKRPTAQNTVDIRPRWNRKVTNVTATGIQAKEMERSHRDIPTGLSNPNLVISNTRLIIGSAVVVSFGGASLHSTTEDLVDGVDLQRGRLRNSHVVEFGADRVLELAPQVAPVSVGLGS